MIKATKGIHHIVEMDGSFHCIAEASTVPIEDIRQVTGDRWLVTDFQEGMARLMTVEGPAKYADLLVQRKLQESGEFEEPVEIFTHWKKKSGKNTTELFFTAVPKRVAQFYLDELRQGSDITLVFPMYALLWNHIKRSGSKHPVAVILRHNRFAEVLIGSRDRVYFANRCVAFDTEADQIEALWNTVRSDIESVEHQHKVTIGRISCVNWLDAHDAPRWPDDWMQRLVIPQSTVMQAEASALAVSWPTGLKKHSAWLAVSAFAEKSFYYTKRWTPAFNLCLMVLAGLLVAGMLRYENSANTLQGELERVQQQINQTSLKVPDLSVAQDFDELLKFIGQLDHHRSMPSYQQVIDHLTQGASGLLSLNHLKLEYTGNGVQLELSGDIEAPFEKAHGGYQRFLRHLEKLDYKVQESRFETQINSSQVLLKLIRPEA